MGDIFRYDKVDDFFKVVVQVKLVKLEIFRLTGPFVGEKSVMGLGRSARALHGITGFQEMGDEARAGEGIAAEDKKILGHEKLPVCLAWFL